MMRYAVFSLLLLLSGWVSGQSLTVQVVDDGGRFLSGVEVFAEPGGQLQKTNGQGQVVFAHIPSDQVKFILFKSG